MVNIPASPAAAAIKLTGFVEGEVVANIWKDPNTEMRLKYLASEKGCHYERSKSSMVRSYDNATVLGPNAAEAAVKSFVASVDPKINAAI
jgi:hypothetical protein